MTEGDIVPAGWKEGPQVAAGAFATVVRCQNAEGQDLPVVAKKLNVLSKQVFEDARTEITILRKLSHENIVRYYGCTSEMAIMYIFVEYVPGGSLTDLLKKSGPLCEERARKYTRQILKGLAYLHSQNVIHRDVKGSNILLDESDTVKLADFGISKVLYPSGTLSGAVSEQVGTLYYMSPEMLSEEGHGRRTDVWSLGCTVVEMLTGDPPWNNASLSVMVRKISSKNKPEYQLPPDISESLNDFLNQCFIWNKQLRPRPEQLLKHEFVREEKSKQKCHCCIL